ncbi:hypothetical protein ACLQ8T_06025 [Glutamicibacter sp. FR1]|uniref:hypothetical protein n=1 Tax=Glutamicibacter sp. FR1 TaxID=3393744 RepID=UPI0039B044C1
MSEFKCAEPGCDYHVGISNGPNLTPEDWESEDYYFQEIEEHQQMHREKTDNEKQDNYFVNVDPETASWLDGQGLMRSWLNKSGQAVPNPLHVPGRAISDVVGSPFARIAAEGDRLAVPVDTPGIASSDIFPESPQKLSIRLETLGAVSIDGRLRIDVEHDAVRTTGADLKLNVAMGSMRPPHVDSFNERGNDFGGGSQGGMPVDSEPDFHFSLSVGGAPRGAVGGTSESTERGLTPGVPEMKEHPAVAAAGCDETKHSNGK